MTINTIIIGAGLAGLTAAKQLQDNKVSYMLVEKASVVGGRLATIHLPEYGIADIGTQFFTARSDTFNQQVNQWHDLGLVYEIGKEWSNGSIRKYIADGSSRYAVKGGMTSLAQYLAKDLKQVCVEHDVARIERVNNLWHVVFKGGKYSQSENLVITVPPPQAMRLFSNVTLGVDTLNALKRIHYQKNLTGIFVVDGATRLPSSGGLQPSDDKESLISWLFDNKNKNDKQSTSIITLQAKRIWSKHNFERDTDDILTDMRQALQPYLTEDSTIIDSQLKRWLYGVALTTHPQLILGDSDLPLIFAGDAFGGYGRIEGAYMSGLTAGLTIAQKLQVI